MKRKEFLGFAMTLVLSKNLPKGWFQNSEFKFNFSAIMSYLDKLSSAERNMAEMMINNLLYDIEYVIGKGDPKMNMALLQKLIAEADKKFFAERKLRVPSADYNPVSQQSLEGLKARATVSPADFDKMTRNIKTQIDKIRKMQDNLDDTMAGIFAAQKKMKETEESQECQKVLSVIAAVAVVVVAIVVAVFTYGASGSTGSLTVIQAASQIGTALVSETNPLTGGLITVGTTGVEIRLNGKTIHKSGDKLNIAHLNEQVRCAIISLSRAIAMNYFTTKGYPRYSIVGAVLLSLTSGSLKIRDISPSSC